MMPMMVSAPHLVRLREVPSDGWPWTLQSQRNYGAWGCNAAAFLQSGPMVTVGTAVASRPPYRSRRALLTHRAAPSGFGVEAVTG
jgi:hypothetical protein